MSAMNETVADHLTLERADRVAIVTVESDALGWTPMFRRFRDTLGHVVKGAS